MKTYITKKIVISSDHAGYSLKKKLIAYFNKFNLDILDLGPFDDSSVDYPDYAKKLCKKISSDNFGILICGTGIGMSIMANRYKKIRASLVYSSNTAKLAREHNNANVLILGSRSINKDLAIKIVNIFFKTRFLKGRHLRRVNKFKNV